MILDKIVLNKRKEIEALKNRRDVSYFENIFKNTPTKDFSSAIRKPFSLIAEVKKASPSAGIIKKGYDPARTAKEYERSGASAISVLTDRKFFGGTIEDLKKVSKSVKIPVLRKDFIIDEIQLYEARAGGADAVLLIVRILNDDQLRKFIRTAESLGMDALIEVHSKDELNRVLKTPAKIIGINNRDLDNLKIDLNTTLNLRKDIPGDIIVVSESGIKTVQDINKLKEKGVNAVLMGEALMRADNIGAAIKKLSF